MEGIGVCGCCAFYTMYKNIQYGADRPDSMSARSARDRPVPIHLRIAVIIVNEKIQSFM